MTKSIKLNASKIIGIRDEINATKKKYWGYIRSENVMSKKDVKNGYRTHDLKNLLNEITQMADKLVIIKGILATLNTGSTTFDKDAFKKTNNYSIFMACEMKEIIAQLKMIPTLNAQTKAQKGLKAIGKEEIFTSAKIASLIKEYTLKANKYNTDMENFNNKTDIDLDATSGEMFKSDIAI